MVFLVDDLEVLPGHMGIDLGGGDATMPQHHLNGAEVCASLQQVGGEGMPQGVGGKALGNSRTPRITLQSIPKGLSAHLIS